MFLLTFTLGGKEVEVHFPPQMDGWTGRAVSPGKNRMPHVTDRPTGSCELAWRLQLREISHTQGSRLVSTGAQETLF